jgi:hypothetical protein
VKFYKSYLQQYTKIIKIPTLQPYFSLKFIKNEAYTKPNDVSDLYVLNWKSSYDVMLLMCQSRQQRRILIFAILDQEYARIYLYVQYCIAEL